MVVILVGVGRGRFVHINMVVRNSMLTLTCVVRPIMYTTVGGGREVSTY